MCKVKFSEKNIHDNRLKIRLKMQAAFANDVSEIRRLIANKVDPTAADYDLRSGLVINFTERHCTSSRLHGPLLVIWDHLFKND